MSTILFTVGILTLCTCSWIALQCSEVGTPLAKRFAGRAMLLLCATLAAIALLPRMEIPRYQFLPEASAAYVAQETSRVYHRPGCPYAAAAQPITSTKGRVSCPWCLAEERVQDRTAYRAEDEGNGDKSDAGEDGLPASLLHEQSPVQ